MEKYFTVKEVAETLKVSVWTVRKWITDEKLKSVRTGKVYRISETHLTTFLKQAEQETAVE